MDNIESIEQNVSEHPEQDLGEACLERDLAMNRSNENIVEISSNCPMSKGNGAENKAVEPPTYIYAIGKILVKYPNTSVEKELMMAAKELGVEGKTEEEIQYEVLSNPKFRYLRRMICWVMKIDGVETYIVVPRDIQDFDLLLETIAPKRNDLGLLFDVIVGNKGPIAPPEMCNNRLLPIAIYDQVYSFDLAEFIEPLTAIYRERGLGKEKFDEKSFTKVVADLFDRILQATENEGATDAARSVNFLLMRDRDIFDTVVDMNESGNRLSSIDVRPSRLSGIGRNLVDVIFTFTNINTNVISQFYVCVDISGEFPFIVTPMRAFFER